MNRSHGVSVRLSAEILASLDGIAATWGLNRAATLRRLVELADVEAGPVGVPSMDELFAIASEKARNGNMAAVSFLAARQPDEREAEFQRLLERLGGRFAVSAIVLDALRALGPRPALCELEMVAAALRSGDAGAVRVALAVLGARGVEAAQGAGRRRRRSPGVHGVGFVHRGDESGRSRVGAGARTAVNGVILRVGAWS